MAVIEARQEQFQIDYTSELLPGLFHKQDSDSNFSDALLHVDCEWLKANLIKSSKLTLLIAVEQISDQGLIKVIQETADRGVRIYLLLGDERVNQAAIDALSGRCLIRTGVAQCGALVLADHSTNKAQGWLVMNHLIFSDDKAEAWAIQLEADQIDDSFRSFCKLFWEHSQNEYLQQNLLTQKTEHPDKKIVTNHSHHLCGTLEECLGDTLATLQAVSCSELGTEGSNYRLLKHTDSSSIIGRQGVALTDTAIPSLLISEQGSWLLPDAMAFKVANWCLCLSEQQGKKMVSAYEVAFEEAAWQYQSEAILGELSDERMLRFSDQPELIRRVKAVRKKELEAVSVQSLDSFLYSSAEQLTKSQTGCQRNFLSHRIDYSVVIHPPYCPVTAQPDKLYSDWQQAEHIWQERLSSLQHRQSFIDDQQSDIADKLKGFLKSFILGQGQSVKAINRELAELKDWSVTKATPSERQEYRRRLVKLAEDISNRGRHTATELDKAEQNHRWEEKLQKLQRQERVARELVRAKKSAHDALLADRNSKNRSAERDFTHSWQDAVQVLSDEQLRQVRLDGVKPEQFLPNEMPEDKEEQAAVKLQAEGDFLGAVRAGLLSMDHLMADALRQSSKEKIFRKHYSKLNRAIEDHHQALHKIDRDLQEALKDVEKAKVTLAAAEMALKSHGSKFEYQVKNSANAFEQQLGLKGSKLNTHFDWPKEELPAAGSELKVDNQRRWLVIRNTDQIDQAKIDAELLNATVCVNRPASYGVKHA
ncbi:hypothetical protein [Vibrio sp. CAU 1672]|uniref:hypothetical protein n=1 Tax=Vibrio sp. CAU 1672 TaxID=3032594 RepID=UPI0023DB5A6F|nr:hypothetical protein [Vibrio sp. CAU 1672]MDF2152533.1 hypothetical protein [Vibrio sp. CAU 1672]